MSRTVTFSDDELQAIRRRYEDEKVPLSQLSREFGHSRPIITKAVVQAGGRIRPRGYQKVEGPTLGDRLRELERILREPINDEVLKTVVDYALGFNDGRTFRKIDRRHGYEGALSQFRKDRLESSYYVMGRLWRATYRVLTHKNVRLADFGVDGEDIRLILSVLDEEQRESIRTWVKTHKYIWLPNDEGVQSVVEACEKTYKSIVNSKLRFIYQYDPAYEKDDLISELRLIAFKVAQKYDWEVEDGKFAYEKCLNFTRRSLWNAAYLLIKQNTSDEYKRLERVDTDQRLYQITTISMDSPLDDEWVHIQKKLGEPEDTTVEIKDLVTQIGDDKLMLFLRLETEDVPEFDEFVRTEAGHEENDLYTDDYPRWRELALRFAGISSREDRVAIKRRVRKEMGLWDRARIKKPRKKRARKS